jgi:hypothetical protein
MINKPVWVQKLALLLETNQIDIDMDMKGASEMRKQLESFAGTVRASGSTAYEDRQGHDDNITCLLLSIVKQPRAFAFQMPQQSPAFYEGRVHPPGM